MVKVEIHCPNGQSCYGRRYVEKDVCSVFNVWYRYFITYMKNINDSMYGIAVNKMIMHYNDKHDIATKRYSQLSKKRI